MEFKSSLSISGSVGYSEIVAAIISACCDVNNVETWLVCSSVIENCGVASIVVVVDGSCADDNGRSLFCRFSQISKLLPPIKDSI